MDSVVIPAELRHAILMRSGAEATTALLVDQGERSMLSKSPVPMVCKVEDAAAAVQALRAFPRATCSTRVVIGGDAILSAEGQQLFDLWDAPSKYELSEAVLAPLSEAHTRQVAGLSMMLCSIPAPALLHTTFSHLRTLTLAFVTSPAELALAWAPVLPSLEELRVQEWGQLAELDLGGAPRLEVVALDWVDGLAALRLGHLPRLRALSILKDSAVVLREVDVTACPQLQRITLHQRYCSNYEDAVVIRAGECARLQELDLRSEDEARIRVHLPPGLRLQHLTLSPHLLEPSALLPPPAAAEALTLFGKDDADLTPADEGLRAMLRSVRVMTVHEAGTYFDPDDNVTLTIPRLMTALTKLVIKSVGVPRGTTLRSDAQYECVDCTQASILQKILTDDVAIKLLLGPLTATSMEVNPL